MSATNWNCDGSGPHTPGEVRKLPTNGGANLILCRACWLHELRWRESENRRLGTFAQYELPEWKDAEVYA